jgi:hypothetical protein
MQFDRALRDFDILDYISDEAAERSAICPFAQR